MASWTVYEEGTDMRFLNHGKWYAFIIHIKDDLSSGYTMHLNTEKNGEILFGLYKPLSYTELKKQVKEATGIDLVERKHLHFGKLSDYEDMAVVNACMCIPGEGSNLTWRAFRSGKFKPDF